LKKTSKFIFLLNIPFYLLNPVKLIVALADVPGFFSKNKIVDFHKDK